MNLCYNWRLSYSGGECSAHKKHYTSSYFSVPGNPDNMHSPEWLLFTTRLSVVSQMMDRWQEKGVRMLGDVLVLCILFPLFRNAYDNMIIFVISKQYSLESLSPYNWAHQCIKITWFWCSCMTGELHVTSLCVQGTSWRGGMDFAVVVLYCGYTRRRSHCIMKWHELWGWLWQHAQVHCDNE